MSSEGSDTLATLSQDGTVPECRMQDAVAVQDFVRRMMNADQRRSWKRSRVNGLVDGNPPYKASKLREANRSDACNVNWGTSRSYMESGSGAFYDLFSEAPGFLGIKTDYGTEEQKEQWSLTLSQEADCILSKDDVWDYTIQQSQWEMVLHGCGPLMFEDGFKVLPKSFHCGDLKVPEFTKSDTTFWDACSIDAEYYPPQLYEFIENAKAATAVGWNVEHAKKVISNAMNIKQQNGAGHQWEFYQQELKNNSLNYYDDTKICKLSHVFWKEFDGRITHAIVEQTTSSGTETKFLYKKVGRYSGWQNGIHPLYFDRGNGGYHHSVTGLGVKMFGSMEYQNRLLCNLADKTFAPKVLFKPTTTEASQKFSMAHFGDFAVLPANFEWVQTGIAGLVEDGLVMNRSITDLMRENLSSYRQGPMKQDGNPPTARQVMYDATQQSSLSKTTFNRYYKQLDLLYTEIVRRLCIESSPDERAKDFQKRCLAKGVPKECFQKIEKVEAVRVVGQGNAFMRREAVNALLPFSAALPEQGRDNLIADKIAAEAGSAAVSRYYPRNLASRMPTDQEAEAKQWVGLMRIGVSPTVTSSQNPVTFATVFVQAAAQALESLTQGANPMDVLAFLEVCGPAIAAHLRRFGQDPTRKQSFDILTQQWKQLAALTDKLRQQVQQMQETQAGQMEKTQSAMSDEQLKQAKALVDIQTKTAKTAAQLEQSKQKHDLKIQQGIQSMALKDAQTAADIQIKAASSKQPEGGE